MKKILLFAAFYCSASVCFAQEDATASVFKKIQQIQDFQIYTAPDSILFTNKELQNSKPFILVFFNPDCDHCQKETKEFLAYKEDLKDIQMLMVSALPYKLIKDFYIEYNMVSMPNVKMGQDLNFVLGNKYHPGRYPGIYIYDASGNLIKVFAGNVGVPKILEALK